MISAGRRVNPYDVRPHLLALCGWQDLAQVAPCVEFGRNYLAAWCRRLGTRSDPAILEAAAVDGLLLVYWGRATRRRRRPTVEQRSHDLHVRLSRYLTLRGIAERAFRARLAERLAPVKAQDGDGIAERLPAFGNPRRRAAQCPAVIQR